MKKVTTLQFSLHRELCIFKRSSQVRDCQMDYDRRVLKGAFPKEEIDLAVNVFNAIVITVLTA